MVIMIVAIVYFFAAALVYFNIVAASSLSFLSLGGLLTLGSWSAFALVGVGLAVLAFVVSPEGAQEVLGRVASGVSGLLKGAGTILGGVIGGAVAAVSGSGIVGIVLAAAGGYLLFKYLSKKADEPTAGNQQIDNGRDSYASA